MGIADQRMDHLESTGFDSRLDDHDRLVDLGASLIRMSVLWERSEPDSHRLDFG